MNVKRGLRAFTLVELIVVISVLAILSGVLVPRVTNHLKAARDARRLADVKALRNAVEQFHSDRGEYPAANTNSSFGGWDGSHDGDFIHTLVEDGYLEEQLLDPVNNATYHYRYYVYAQGAYGCKGAGKYYVLGIRNFENQEFAARNRGFFQCASRDWGDEFAYVTGGGASFAR